MANIIKRIMCGSELIGYVTDSPNTDEKYMTKYKAIEAIHRGTIANATVGVVEGKEIVKGANGTNLNDIDRLNINIDGLNENSLKDAKTSYNNLLAVIKLSESLSIKKDFMGKFYTKLVSFKNNNKLDDVDDYDKLSNSLKGISVRGHFNSGVYYIYMDMSWVGVYKGQHNSIILCFSSDGAIEIYYNLVNKIGGLEKNRFKFEPNNENYAVIKLNEILNYAKDSTYPNRKAAVEGFILQHNGKTPQEVEQENIDKSVTAIRAINKIFCDTKATQEIAKFIHNKNANITDVSNRVVSKSQDETLVRYEFIISWNQRGYKETFKMKFNHDISYDCNVPFDTFIVINLIKENGKLRAFKFKPLKLNRNEIKLIDVDNQVLLDISNNMRRITAEAIAEASEISDKSNSDIIKGWFRGRN